MSVGATRAWLRPRCVAYIFVALHLSASYGGAPLRQFTVRDSIELARFTDPFTRDPGASVKIAPDGRHFLVVTTRGHVATNNIESSLWVFGTERVLAFVHARDGVAAPIRKRVVRLIATPRVLQQDSYGSLITDARWSSDSRSIFFLGETTGAIRRLNRVRIEDGKVQSLSGKAQDVQGYSAVGDTIVYAASQLRGSAASRHGLSQAIVSSLSGRELGSILFPGDWETVIPELWVHQAGRKSRLRDPASAEPLRMPASVPFTPAISPHGGAVVVALAVQRVPRSWQSYLTTQSWLHFRGATGPADSTRAGGGWVWPTQYAIVDLRRRTVTRLVDAPVGRSGGFVDASKAVWSPTGHAILLTNTYLPLDHVDTAEGARRSRPCAAAVVIVPKRETSCVVFSESSDQVSILRDAAFGARDREVSVRMWSYHGEEWRHYVYEDGKWRPASLAPQPADALAGFGSKPSRLASGLSVTVKQELNVPPALWATDEATGQSRELWNPSPQLKTLALGEASTYKWKDSSGYEWTGGLIKPTGYIAGNRYPLVIETHGFRGEAEFITDGSFTTAFAARPLASSGFVVLETRVRNDQVDTADEAPGAVQEYEAAITRLDADGLVDRTRVGIIGFSRTCYHAESALIQYPEQYSAASIADGIDASYLQHLLFGEGSDYIHTGEGIYGVSPFGDGLKKWVEAAPGFNLNRVQTPLLIQAILPPAVLEEWEIYASLRLQHKPVDLMYIPDGQHILQKPLERLASQQTNLDWFRFWLQGYEDPDKSKVEQYQRWEELCDLQVTQHPHRASFCVRSKTHKES